MKVIYDELKFENQEESEIEFESLFDNSYEGKQYVIGGKIGLWDGVRDGYYPKVANSLAEAISNATEGFGLCYVTVSEGKYGKLFVDVLHHDGSNHLEVKELTDYGEELISEYNEVGTVINKDKATRNVKFCKNYL